MFKQFKPIHTGHEKVGNHQIEVPALQEFHCLDTVAGLIYLVTASRLQDLANGFSD
jgi:hypothetical protein